MVVKRSFYEIFAKTVPNLLDRQSNDQRQINIFQLIQFKDKRLLVALTGIIFLSYSLFLIQLGFGEDTDAWLMAQSAEKIRLGLGYDPARSFGNPIYEWGLSIFQTGNQWWVSNLANLLIFFVLLNRLRNYFPLFTPDQLAGLRLLFLLFPLFIKNATSSIEFIWGLWFLMEAFHNIENKQSQKAIFWTIMAMFTRLEYFPILVISQVPFWQKNKGKTLIMTAFWVGYLIWAWGKNPAPFHTVSEGVHFYQSRIGILIESLGLSTLLLPILLYHLIRNQKIRNLKTMAIANLGFFILFPFEWEYALPFFGASFVAIADEFPFVRTLAFGLLFLFLTFFKPELRNWFGGKISFRFEWPHEQRECSFARYVWAQSADFEQKTLILNGATLFPFPVKNWEKVKDNRIFHRQNSNFFVGERLTTAELDSLKSVGFQIKN